MPNTEDLNLVCRQCPEDVLKLTKVTVENFDADKELLIELQIGSDNDVAVSADYVPVSAYLNKDQVKLLHNRLGAMLEELESNG